jgi:AcrR family transcriptional regulator
MMRKRHPGKLDSIIAAATGLFIEHGYTRSKISDVAGRARIGPGTVYLYVEDKEALFELALLRALESPIVAHPPTPYKKTGDRGRRQLITDCIREVAHFPQLWVANQRRALDKSHEEYHGILLEIIGWLKRYRNAVLLADRNRLDWPELAQVFQSVIWNDLHQRLTAYLATRMRAGQLNVPGDPAVVARFTLDSLVAYLVTGPIAPGGPGSEQEEVLARLVSGALVESRDWIPFSTHPGQDPGV